MRLEIEDFNEILSVKNRIEEESKEEIEKKYIEEIQRLKREYQEKLKEEVESAYKKGFHEGYERANNELKREYQRQIEEIFREKEEELKSSIEKLGYLEGEIRKKFDSYLNSVRELIVDSIYEILEFLYVELKDRESIVKAIERIILEFKESGTVEILAGKELYEILKNSFSNIKLDDSLDNNDFVINFGDFQIENRLKEKLNIIKDEIKREIKKLT